MRNVTLRQWAVRIGLLAMPLGVIVLALGVLLGSVAVTALGGMTISVGAYALVFSHIGSF